MCLHVSTHFLSDFNETIFLLIFEKTLTSDFIKGSQVVCFGLTDGPSYMTYVREEAELHTF